MADKGDKVATEAIDRGNDFDAADRELVAAGYGEYPDATALLEAKAAAFDQETAAANLKRENEEATAKVDASEIDVPDGHTVISYAVRGDRIVYVADDGTGLVYKASVPYEGDD